ncbi:hypothetical protein HID58_066403 [Brassica napus]|uniref:Uncharacterized protein n=1 Tax=Brassica napus TaxID=3708 RepID=A0ABQ7ZFU2_BRANA|nr:hypothetical protein HID58_066403 [Brassica napus]
MFPSTGFRPKFQTQPWLANALVAAMKRAQAHQRRGVVVDSSSRLTKQLANPTAHSHPNHHSSFTSLHRPAISGLSIFLLPGLLHLPRVALTLLSYGDQRKFFGFSCARETGESRVGFFRSQFPRKGFEFQGLFSEALMVLFH